MSYGEAKFKSWVIWLLVQKILKVNKLQSLIMEADCFVVAVQ